MSKVSVVLVNYIKYEDTIECIKSLEKSTYKDIEVIVVDNNSTNDSVDILKSYNFSVPTQIISLKENLGFAKANNYGAKMSLAESEYLFILNNDTIIKENCIDVLVREFENLKEAPIFALTGKAYYYDNPNVLWWAGIHPNEHLRSPKRINKQNKDKGKYDRKKEVDFITGAFLFCKKDLFIQKLFFDEAFFFGLEDYELSYRCKKLGYKMLYIPEAIIWHKVGQTRHFNARHIFNAYASMILGFKKMNKPKIAKIKISLYKLKIMSTLLFRYKIKRNISLSFKEYYRLTKYTFDVMKNKNEIIEEDWAKAENFIKNHKQK